MTLDTKRIQVLLELLREALPPYLCFNELAEIERIAVNRPKFTSEQYDRVPDSYIVIWNCGSKVQAIKDCRDLFPELCLLEMKQLLESHPRTK